MAGKGYRQPASQLRLKGSGVATARGLDRSNPRVTGQVLEGNSPATAVGSPRRNGLMPGTGQDERDANNRTGYRPPFSSGDPNGFGRAAFRRRG